MVNKSRCKNAFTLLEVMVAVMIITVVIMALIQMYANNTHIFLSLKQKTQLNQYASLLVGNKNYGWENDEIDLYRLVENYNLETDLRRELKSIKIDIKYDELKMLDMSEEDLNENSIESSSFVFEIGNTIIRSRDASTALLRFRIP